MNPILKRLLKKPPQNKDLNAYHAYKIQNYRDRRSFPYPQTKDLPFSDWVKEGKPKRN